MTFPSGPLGRSPSASSDSQYARSGRRRGTWRTAIGAMIAVPSMLVVAAGVGVTPIAFASTATAAVFTGGAGTASVGGTLYAKSGGALTLTVTTSPDTRCVEVAGDLSGRQTSLAKSSWTFTFTAGSGDGAQAVTAAASPSFDLLGRCTGDSGSAQASFTLDNTAPVVSATLSPAANAAGWNNSDTTVTWTAIDAGSGVGSGPTPASSTENANGIVTRTSTAADRLGNRRVGSVTVRVDMANPLITAAQATNPDGTTTIAFTCTDSLSGIARCIASGTNPPTNSRTVGPGTTVTGTATDQAGNTATVTSRAPGGDVTPPTLSGSPRTSPNAVGWYSGDVIIHWTAADPESGVPVSPADTTIIGEGTGLTSSTTVQNGAGLSTTATSSPSVNIDRTAPTTGITGTSNNWVNGDVTVALSAFDNLSTVDTTQYTIDGGATQIGTSFRLSTDGDHTITFFSTDKAGNAEAAQSAHVKIDKTAPTISHTFTPLTYTDGAWTNQDVTVTFTCADQGGSGLADCTPAVVNSAEGSYTVPGIATDVAGNSASDSASVRIDKTPPTITPTVIGTINPAGWYKADVTVTYSATDDASGVVDTPADEVLGEGADQSAGATVTDAAGNAATADVTGINVDKTAPVLTGAFAPGWNAGDVTVTWTCTDSLSGPAAQPPDTSVAGEGDNLTSSTSCSDVAGNFTATTVSGIQIDRTAPTTTSNVADPPDSGWFTGAVQVTLTGHDNLSGIAATYYTVDGGSSQVYGGPFPFGTEGIHTISFWSQDVAGNIETAGAPLTLKVDTTAPTTTAINPISPASGWFVTSGIPVAFNADDGAGSGIKATYYAIDGGEPQTYGEPFHADLSDGTHTITYWSVDLADNVGAQAEITINVATVPPTITGAITGGTKNASGWYNGPVTVTFTCSDALAGIAFCPDPVLLTDNGANTASGTATDRAGNSATASVSGINIDQEQPTLTPAGINVAGATYILGAVPAATCTASDNFSGVASCNVIVTGGNAHGVGPFTYVATAMDNAGNTTTLAGTFQVIYRFDGFLQPINDPVHHIGVATSVFKAGSTVPVKFQLKNAAGAVVSNTGTASWLTPVEGLATTVPIDEVVETPEADSGSVYRYDGQRYIYNWKTGAAGGHYWRIGVTLDDGQTYFVTVGLR